MWPTNVGYAALFDTLYVSLEDDAPHVREGGEVMGVVSCDVRAYGDAGKVVRVASGVFRECGEVPAGG